MYWQDKWVFKDTIEYEYKFAGKYGAKGEKRSAREKPSPEIIKKQNQRNKEKRMRRLIKANFGEGDLWLTLKYPKGTRLDSSEVKADLKKFIDAMRRKYKRYDEEFKFIYRIEVGKQGGIHIHMIVPRIRGADTEVMLQRAWKQGRINYQHLDNGDYKELASYITKPPDEEVDKQISLFTEEERKDFIKYSSSRNLIRPEPERKVYSRRTMSRIIRDGPEPSPGYYIDKSSVVFGINRYTGMSYLYYTERKLKEAGSG